MALPNQKYVSKAVPFGALSVEIFRLANPDDNASGVSLGVYKLESITPQDSASLQKRPDIDGGKNGWWIVGGDTEGSCVIQRNVAATPALTNGDYFVAGIRVSAAGAIVDERFVLHGVGHEVGASYRKQSCSVIVDADV